MNLREAWPARVVALVTVVYSTALTISPKLLAGPTGLTDAAAHVPPAASALLRSIGVRDAALAAAWRWRRPGTRSGC